VEARYLNAEKRDTANAMDKDKDSLANLFSDSASHHERRKSYFER
jgi:hypothetical protein